MSLFPAYGQTSNTTEYEELSGEYLAEAQLLASDTDEEREVCPRAASPPAHHQHFYVDRKLDVANLRVSTLYYPGRPQLVITTGAGLLHANVEELTYALKRMNYVQCSVFIVMVVFYRTISPSCPSIYNQHDTLNQ